MTAYDGRRVISPHRSRGQNARAPGSRVGRPPLRLPRHSGAVRPPPELDTTFLDGLRGLAALYVFVRHASVYLYARPIHPALGGPVHLRRPGLLPVRGGGGLLLLRPLRVRHPPSLRPETRRRPAAAPPSAGPASSGGAPAGSTRRCCSPSPLTFAFDAAGMRLALPHLPRRAGPLAPGLPPRPQPRHPPGQPRLPGQREDRPLASHQPDLGHRRPALVADVRVVVLHDLPGLLVALQTVHRAGHRRGRRRLRDALLHPRHARPSTCCR